jgi:Tol biopolymer transport system component
MIATFVIVLLIRVRLRRSHESGAMANAVDSGQSGTSSFAHVDSRRDPNDEFAIYINDFSGKHPTLVFSDPAREVNHARVSPDRQWIVFARYNSFNWRGNALETNGYARTEVIRCRIDGSDCASLIPPRRGIVAANAYWTPDGHKLLFVSTGTPNRRTAIKVLEPSTGQISTLYYPLDILPTDPHQVGDLIVMAGRALNDPDISRLYLLSLATGSRRTLTDPKFANFRQIEPPLGDHDPKLSPDGTRVAVMRHMARNEDATLPRDRDDWSIVVVDLAIGRELNLAKPNTVDAVPEWSSDGRLLIFWSIVRDDLKKSGLCTMQPDGSNRRRIPLPRGFFYTMPAFVPGTGSGPDSQIIYSARANPNL